jgi:nitrate/TMAO reductase-like tetraheme cytochrome c subunit
VASARVGRVVRRAATWSRLALLALVFALAVLTPATLVAVEASSQPEFCGTCHIMDPYYASWQASPHSEVACIECHIDPGILGTVRGKFQALSQLAKYVTRTQGTRPWAEVSDASCLRSGCHSVETLEGSIAFGRGSFDHRPHLLEPRGMRLRCVTCHSQNLIDEHFAVEESVCFTCHFTPGGDGEVPASTGECGSCHGPPVAPLEVAGKPFDHAAFVERGVDCKECHARVIEGAGTVHEQRCRSCHGEPEKLAHAGEPELLHRVHVTEHKVECSECHLDIRHGLPEGPAHPVADGGCAACHAGAHGAARLVYAGAGASDVAETPSRMHETSVACDACHTGRGAAAGGPARLGVAGEVDCLHCHGVAFAGMLAEWQGAVGDGLERLRVLVDDVARDAGAALGTARADLELVERDGSRGAHNAPYALDVLRSVARRLDAAAGGVPARANAASALAALPIAPDPACAACHVDVARHDPAIVNGRPFHHDRHLRQAGLGCSTCHASTPFGVQGHGAPSLGRDQCASCHHAERERLDPSDCGACHALQAAFLAGTVEGFEAVAAPMAGKDCQSCHGEPPDVVIPAASLCVLCHEPGYDAKLASWREGTDELVARLRAALATPDPAASTEAVAAARRALELVVADGSRGAHGIELAQRVLGQALAGLEGDGR